MHRGKYLIDKVASSSDSERKAIFISVADSLGVAPIIIEKDFWVCWVLQKIYSTETLRKKLMFKGGTSLSKVFGLINRFSEDIDLILNWEELIDSDLLLEFRSKSKQDKFNKEIIVLSRSYIKEKLLKEVSEAVHSLCNAEIDDKEADVINIVYPASFSDKYIRPEIRLEIGPLASWVPNDSYPIKSSVATLYPDIFEKKGIFAVNAIRAERTFFEKVVILHAEAHRPSEKNTPPRHSRHYYDIHMMVTSKAIKDISQYADLLEDVVEFKQKFYPCAWANYDLARLGSMRLVPKREHLESLAKDYQEMRHMIFGNNPSFDDIISTIKELEIAINQIKRK